MGKAKERAIAAASVALRMRCVIEIPLGALFIEALA
jgi:hypothetical protein